MSATPKTAKKKLTMRQIVTKYNKHNDEMLELRASGFNFRDISRELNDEEPSFKANASEIKQYFSRFEN